MAQSHVVSGLVEKRGELAGQAEHHGRELKRLAQELGHLDAAIRLFDPDYRAEACFDNATRANLGGLDHPGRVFLGLALLHRYKNSRAGSRMEPLFRLLPETDIQEAEALGKAMRFGAMFSIGDPSKAGALRWNPKKRVLTLALTEDGVSLFGEVAQARFAALAVALKAQAKVQLRDAE